MIVFGGSTGDINYVPTQVNDVWVLSNADGTGGTPAWTQLSPAGGPPSGRAWHSAVYDAANNRMIVFGGNPTVAYCYGTLNDAWVLSNANGLGGTPAWTQLSPSGGPPGRRNLHAAVYDAVNNRMMVYGGQDACGPLLPEVWVLSNANGLGGTPAWTQLTLTGTVPAARNQPTLAYDATNNRMVVFGGGTDSGAANDVWILTNANGLGGTPGWSELLVSGTKPSIRSAHAAEYDAPGNKLIAFGGSTPVGVTNDVWTLSFANGLGGTPAWTLLASIGTAPSKRDTHSAVLNSANGRMIIFGGRNCDSGCVPLNDAHVLSGLANSSPQLMSTNFFGGTGDQRGTAITIANNSVYAIGVGAETGGSSDTAFLFKYALPLSSSPAWSRTVAGGTALYGLLATSDGVYANGRNYSHTTDGAGGKESKAILGKFSLDNSNGPGPEGSIWLAGSSGTASRSSFFAYGGAESFSSVTVATEDGTPVIYAAGGGQPCSYGSYLVAKYDTVGNKIAAATDSSVGINFAQCYTPPGAGGSDSLAVTLLGTNVCLAGHSGWAVDGDSPNTRPAVWLYSTNLSLTLRYRDTDLAGSFRAVTTLAGAIYVAGYKFTPGSANSEDYLIEKLDAAGNRLWRQTWGGGATDMLRGITTVNGRLFAAGYTKSEGAGAADMVLFEFNPATGAILSTNLFGGAQDDMANGIATDGTDLYVVGETKSFAVGGNTVGQNEIVLLRYAVGAAAPPALAITTTSLPAGQVNQAYSQQLQAAGGTVPYSWTLVSGGGSLPAGLNLSSGGSITGTPTTAGTNAFSVKVTDAAALSVTQALSIAITSAPASTLPVVVGSVSIGSQSPAQIAVNPNTDRVYIGSGYAEGTATVFNVANKNAPAVVTTVSGAGVAVNPASNRFYTSSGFGGTIRVYNGVDNTLITTSTAIGYCGGQLDVDETRNLIYMTSQCGGGNDPLHVLDGGNNSITGGPLGSGGIVGSVRVNPSTGRAYVARSGGTRVFGPSPSFANLGDLTGTIAGINSAANRLYFSSGSDLLVRDGSTHALIATITGAAGAAGINTNRNRVYVPDGASQNVKIIDGNTHTVIGTFTLGTGVTPGGAVAVDSAKNRIYITGSASGTTSLYVIEDTGSVPLAVTTQSLPDGQVGQAYSAELHAGGGALPYTWTLATGSNPLPTGLSLSSGGTISGTPTVANSFTFTVQVTDNTAYSTNKTFTVTITSGAAIQLASQNYLGATGDERGTALAVASGAVYVSGVTAANGDEGLVARYALPVSSAAAPVWQATWPGLSSSDHFYGIAAAGDSVYLAGDSYQRTSDTIGGKENKGIVVKFPLSGATGGGFGGALWDRPTPPPPGAFGYGGSESLNGIAVAVEGAQTNVYATGQGQNGFANGGRMYLSKLAADSTVLWTVTDAASQSGNAYSSGRAVTTLNGNIYVAGRNDDSGSTRAYLRKYDASGTLLWSLASTPGEFHGVTAFGGAIYAVGATGFGLAADFLVEKRDEAGNVVWTMALDRNSAEDILYGVVGIGSRIYAVGSTKGNTAGGSDAIVLEIDPATGALLSSTLYGGAENDLATAAATDGVDLYVVGSTRSFGGGDTDLMLLRYTVAQPGQALAIATTALSAGFINQPYSAQLQSVGGTLPHTWSLASGSGPLPGGLTLSPGGVIQGAPTASGTFAFTVQVTDSATPTAATATKPLSITVSTTNAPPAVTLTSPANGSTFTAPASITLTAAASDTDGTIARVEFYAGPTLLGTVTSSPFTLTLTNQSAGSYSFTAVAKDDLGASQTSAPINVTVNAAGGAALINFDPLDAAGGVVTGDALSNYLAGFGVTLSNVTAGTRVVVMSDENIYAGQAALASSRKNVLTQVDSNDPVNFTLRFASPLASFTFTRPKLIAGPSGITHPYWRARAYDASGEELGSVREELIASFSDVPAATFTLNGPGIVSVRFDSENRHFAAFNAVLLDDFVLTGTSGNSPPTVSLTSPANGATFTAPANITLTAAASDSDGSVARVDFFSAAGPVGTVTTAPFTLNLTNLGPGSYSFQALATDNLGATRSSTIVNVTVSAAANTTIVNFDALNAVNGSVGGVALANYLAGFGITLNNVTAGTRVEAVNNLNLYGGAATVAPSPENLLTQVGLNSPVSFTLQFSAAQSSIQFTRPKLLAGPSGVTHPFWRARAFDVAGVELSAVTEQLTASFSDVPAKTFTLNGPGITAVRFDSENRNFAAFSAVLLDDLVLTSSSANSPPTVGITTPANNASFAAPANVIVTIAAADSDGSVVRVDFYLGTTLVGSMTNAPYTLALTNLAAGSYVLSARAVDNLGATAGSTPVNVTVTGSSASTTINFDALDAATGGEATGVALANYLAAFGVTISELSANTRLSVLSDTNIYGGGVVEAPSRYNVLTQLGSNDPVEYALRFGQPLESFQFTRAKLFAGPSGVTHPFWRVRAFDAAGVELGSVTEQLIASFSDVPAQTFKLTGPGIKSVQVESENRHFAAFSAVLLDNLVLNSTVTNNPPTVSITNPTNGATFAAASDLTINATAADSDGTVARVDFYANTNLLIGTDSSAPFSITWSNVAAGTYSLTARATDSGGAERASIPVTVTVTSPAAAPTIVAQPRSQSVAVGAYVSFSVAANGFQPLHYQWRFKGANIPVTTSTLIIPVAQVGDSGAYSVIVTNSFGTVTSADATLSVLNPVSITSHPQGQVVLAGANVTLAVSAAGSTPLRHQWQLNGTIIPEATNSTLVLNDVRPFDSGSYRVVVANALGAVNSQTANLVVLPAAGNLFQANNDSFQDRLAINPLSGPTYANNIGASREPGEPVHGGKQGDKSVWFMWRGTFSGEMALTTRGSGFDTLLAVYTNSASPASLANLVLVAEDDDAGEFLTSKVTFNAVEGVEYQIAVDGFDRASGTIVLGVPPGGYRVLNAGGTEEKIPHIVNPPQNRTVHVGDNVTNTVSVVSPTPVSYQWFFNRVPIQAATNAGYVLTNVQPAAVGHYTVLVYNEAGSVRSQPVFVEVGPAAAGRSHDKFSDLLAAGGASAASVGKTAKVGVPGVSPGVTGTQILRNFGATTEVGEPNHAGVVGGASRWFSLQAAGNGTFVIDTIGSDIDTVLAVYTGADLFSLNQVAADDNSAPDGIRSLVKFDAVAGTMLAIAVDGGNGAQGEIKLNWQFGNAPAISQPPGNVTVQRAGAATFTVSASGTPAPAYQWRFNGVELPGQTNASLSLVNVQSTNQGPYSVVVSNFAGTASATALLTVREQAQFDVTSLLFSNQQFQFRLTGEPGLSYVIEASTNLLDWMRVHTNTAVNGQFLFLDSQSTNYPRRFYRSVWVP